tara:strand:+ start:3986 stop:4585 length:600 start_codon:yes stop_codon:yes gene_type:complete
MTYPLTRDAPDQFIQAFNKLASTKGSSVDDVKYEGYFETLSDLPIESVIEAGKELQKDPSPFLPDAGTWYRRADHLAWAHVEAQSSRDVKQLTAPRAAEEAEITKTRAARDKFVSAYETLAGRTLSATHPWKQDAVTIPTFYCVSCQDTGFVDGQGTPDDLLMPYTVERVKRCACFMTNPVLEATRSHHRARIAKARSV